MSNLHATLCDLAKGLSEDNYDRSLAQYRFWLDIGVAYGHINRGQVNNDARQMIMSEPDYSRNDDVRLIHPTAHLFFRFTRDMEDHLISWSASEFHRGNCAGSVASCFEENLALMKRVEGRQLRSFLTQMNFIASWANLGFVEEAVIRNHILQSLISQPKLYDH